MKKNILMITIFILILSVFSVGKNLKKIFFVDAEKCISCTICVQKCPTKAIEMINTKAVIDVEKCINCGICEKVCPPKAISQIDIEKVKQDTILKVKEESLKIKEPLEEKNISKKSEVTEESILKKVYRVIADKCIGCTICVKKCPVKAIEMVNGKAIIDAEKCIGCGLCEPVCPVKVIEPIEIKVKKEAKK